VGVNITLQVCCNGSAASDYKSGRKDFCGIPGVKISASLRIAAQRLDNSSTSFVNDGLAFIASLRLRQAIRPQTLSRRDYP
jgi:hypothetical protein